MLTIEGVYRNGKIELSETPVGVDEARVMVVFLPASEAESRTAGAEAERRERAKRLLARMRKGYHLGGGRPYQDRGEIYERCDRRR